MQAAYSARHKVQVRELLDEAPGPQSLEPLEKPSDPRTRALEKRISFLEAKIKDLEEELERARAHLAVDVDVSDFAPAEATEADDPETLMRALRRDPRDEEALRAIIQAWDARGESDRARAALAVLEFVGKLEPAEKERRAKERVGGLIQPQHALEPDAWTKLLLHPDEESTVGDVLGVVAPAVLLGRVSALRRDKQLEAIEADKIADPATSTVQAVRCFTWASAILGMAPPRLVIDPKKAVRAELICAIPPALRLGGQVLSGRSPTELAFVAGDTLTRYRSEHFVLALFPDVRDLEDVFLAALSIGNPGLPLTAAVKARVMPIAKAIEPILEPQAIDRLRGAFLRFVEEGGRTNLHRWAAAVAKTAARAGFLMADDLSAASRMLESEPGEQASERMDDLLSFALSDRYTKLQRRLGLDAAGGQG